MSHDTRFANFNVVIADTNATIDQLMTVDGHLTASLKGQCPGFNFKLYNH